MFSQPSFFQVPQKRLQKNFGETVVFVRPPSTAVTLMLQRPCRCLFLYNTRHLTETTEALTSTIWASR